MPRPIINGRNFFPNLGRLVMEIYGKEKVIKGRSKKRNQYNKLYPIGFTPPEDLWQIPETLDPRMAALGISQSGGAFGASIEYGARNFVHPSEIYSVGTLDKLQNRYAIYDNREEFSKKKFIHLLDNFQEEPKSNIGALKSEPKPGTPKLIGKFPDWSTDRAARYQQDKTLSEPFFQTNFDNEDPTYYGFDLEIEGTSPLINGDILKFIRTFGRYDADIASRENIYKIFKPQLMKFIRSSFITDNPNGDVGNRKFQEKLYYIQSISGLDKIVENFGDGSDVRQFVDYKKDVIQLSFRDDVSQNIGYLTTLYKTLSYSRLQGKYIIPENLLRFDIKITITDIRKFTRFVRNTVGSELSQNLIYAFTDRMSKYEYKLYECQFKFDKMPHGDVVKNGDQPGTEPEEYIIKFDYKFATLNFRKYSGYILGAEPKKGEAMEGMIYYYDVDNSKTLGTFSKDQIEKLQDLGSEKVYSYAIQNLSNTFGDGEGYFAQSTYGGVKNGSQKLYLADIPQPFRGDETREGVKIAPNYGDQDTDSDRIQKLTRWQKLKAAAKDRLKDQYEKLKDIGGDLARSVKNAARQEVNAQIGAKAALLNKTISETLNRKGIPGLSQMSYPRNVYYSNLSPFQQSILNSFGAAGPLVNGLLQNTLLTNRDSLASFNKLDKWLEKQRTSGFPLDERAERQKTLLRNSNIYQGLLRDERFF